MHRDLKSQNVLVQVVRFGGSSQVQVSHVLKLTDFGSARSISESTSAMSGKTSVG